MFRVLIALVVAAMPIHTAMAETPRYKSTEIPRYTVVTQQDDFEIRQYAAHKIAEVSVRGDGRQGLNAGFRALAGYIFGGNAKAEKIEMTAPVAHTPQAGDLWTVSFLIPSRFEGQTLPQPQNNAIRLIDVAPSAQAVLRYSGRWTNAIRQSKAEQLEAWVKAQGLRVASEPRFYFYDDPFTLPGARRNEVAVLVATP